ncbi:MAG: thioesterase [Acutalibacteraceae bacterium]|nr:thioesterase [Acutalibacteraceae bacterium]
MKEGCCMVYEKNFVIGAEHSDYTVRLGNYQFFYLLQNAMIEGFDNEGVGNKGLGEKSNAYWAVTKTRLEILRKPLWNEEVIVRAISTDDSKLRVKVITEIYSLHNELLAKACQELCILDKDTHRVRKLNDTCFPVGENKDTKELEFEKFLFPDSFINRYELTVRSQHIDMSRHVNNVEYIRMAMDTFSVDELCKNDPTVIEVHYTGECTEGETLKCERYERNNESYISIAKNDKKCFEMKICF